MMIVATRVMKCEKIVATRENERGEIATSRVECEKIVTHLVTEWEQISALRGKECGKIVAPRYGGASRLLPQES